MDMGSLIPSHGDASVCIKVVFMIFAAVIDKEILFFINQF